MREPHANPRRGTLQHRLQAAHMPLPAPLQELSYNQIYGGRIMSPPHSHAGVEIIVCFSGRILLETSRGHDMWGDPASTHAQILPAGSLAVIDCCLPHRVQVLSAPYGRWLIHVVDENTCDASKLAPTGHFSSVVMDPPTRLKFQIGFQRLFAAMMSGPHDENEWARQQIGQLVALAGGALGSSQSAPPRPPKRLSTVVSDLISTIHQELYSGVTVEQLARMVGYCTAHVQRAFHEQMGFPITEYISIQRLEQAGWMLMKHSETVRIGEIAESLGFSSPAYFSRYFRRHTGLTPLEYRRRLQTRS